jgi:hypothetical protein
VPFCHSAKKGPKTDTAKSEKVWGLEEEGPSWGPSLAMTPHQKSLITTPQRTPLLTLCGPYLPPSADPLKTLMKSSMGPPEQYNGENGVHEDRCTRLSDWGGHDPNGGLVMVLVGTPPNGPGGARLDPP